MIRDYKRTEEFGMPKLPRLEGRVKITLHNCKNGKNEVIEGKNIVTNAVKDIFANNSMGGIDYSQMLDLASSFYRGVLLYSQPHSNLDADDYFIKGEGVQPLTAHAGSEAPASQEIVNEDLQRGSPTNTIRTENSVKHTWEWGTTQGNGQIASLSLTHADVGNAGTGNLSSAFKALNPYMNVSNLSVVTVGGTTSFVNTFCKYDSRHGLDFYIGDDGDFKSNNHRFSTNKITVRVIPFAYDKAGLHDKTIPTFDFVRKFTVTTSVTFYMMPSYHFDYATKYLWLFTNQTNTTNGFSQTTVYYTVINCVNGTEVTHGTIVSDDSDLGMLSVGGQTTGGYCQAKVNNIIKDGNYVYLPLGTTLTGGNVNSGISNFMGLKKIDITNQSDQTLLLNNEMQTERKAYVKNGGIIINGNRIFNGNVGYTCDAGFFPNGTAGTFPTWDAQEPFKASSVFMPLRFNSTGDGTRYFCVSKFLNTTKFSLPSPVTKTTSTSMTVEYTLTEVSE